MKRYWESLQPFGGEKAIENLTQILQEATAGVTQDYFEVQIDGGDPTYRERVYCYELYHQMRLRWPPGTDYFLNGELDKRAHPILSKLGAGYVKPDLLVHHPGDMKRNHAIMEVKSTNASAAGMRKDLHTLSIFVSRVRYQRAIYLIFGDAALAVAGRVMEIAGQIAELQQIELWLHHAASTEAVHHTTLQPRR